jgi:hypothetical protein
MENISKFLPMGLLCSVVVKILITGANLAEAPVVIALAALVAFNEIRSYDKVIKGLVERLDLAQETDKQQAKEIESIKTYLTSVKISSQVRSNKIG